MGDKRFPTVKWQVRWNWAECRTRDERLSPLAMKNGDVDEREAIAASEKRNKDHGHCEIGS